MCQINNSMIMKIICYLCGCDNFSIEDVIITQPKILRRDINQGLFPYAICPCCGFTIEI